MTFSSASPEWRTLMESIVAIRATSEFRQRMRNKPVISS